MAVEVKAFFLSAVRSSYILLYECVNLLYSYPLVWMVMDETSLVAVLPTAAHLVHFITRERAARSRTRAAPAALPRPSPCRADDAACPPRSQTSCSASAWSCASAGCRPPCCPPPSPARGTPASCSTARRAPAWRATWASPSTVRLRRCFSLLGDVHVVLGAALGRPARDDASRLGLALGAARRPPGAWASGCCLWGRNLASHRVPLPFLCGAGLPGYATQRFFPAISEREAQAPPGLRGPPGVSVFDLQVLDKTPAWWARAQIQHMCCTLLLSSLSVPGGDAPLLFALRGAAR